jgi:hypothetical protein
MVVEGESRSVLGPLTGSDFLVPLPVMKQSEPPTVSPPGTM